MFTSKHTFNIIRLLYFIVCIVAGAGIFFNQNNIHLVWAVMTISAGVAILVIIVDILLRQSSIKNFSHAVFGLFIGLVLAWLISLFNFNEVIAERITINHTTSKDIKLYLDVLLFASFGFISSTLAMRSSRSDFSIIIPYIRFRNEKNVDAPLLICQDMIADKRLIKLIDSHLLSRHIIIPLSLYQAVQEDKNNTHALEVINYLQTNNQIDCVIQDIDKYGNKQKLSSKEIINFARHVNASIITKDKALQQIALLTSVRIIYLDDLIQMLVPSIAVGEKIKVFLIEPGREDQQAIGYLSDGSLVIVNQGITQIGKRVAVTVQSVHDKNNGKMIFAIYSTETA